MFKEVNVKFLTGELEKRYLELSESDGLKKKIDFVINRLKEKPHFGQPIAKRLIPIQYRQQGIKNAYWVELSKRKGWRLIYNLTSENENEIIAIILEWFDSHKKYEKRFNY